MRECPVVAEKVTKVIPGHISRGASYSKRQLHEINMVRERVDVANSWFCVALMIVPLSVVALMIS